MENSCEIGFEWENSAPEKIIEYGEIPKFQKIIEEINKNGKDMPSLYTRDNGYVNAIVELGDVKDVFSGIEIICCKLEDRHGKQTCIGCRFYKTN